MKKQSLIYILFLLFGGIEAQNPISLGSGSFAEFPPPSVYDEGAYFGKPYSEIKDGWPWYIHPDKIGEPIPTNDWWTATIFDQYTGFLDAYPHRVEGTSSGIKVSLPDRFEMQGDRGIGTVYESWIDIRGKVKPSEAPETEVFTGFETETYPQGWLVSENPAYPGPVKLSDLSQTPTPNGFWGDRFVNTYNGNGILMTLTSPEFTIEKDYIYMLVGGGNYPDDAFVGLFVNGQRVLSETGENSGTMTWRQWDVSSFKGQNAEIRIVDNTTGGWGFIMCDNIVFTDLTEIGSSFTDAFWPSDAKVYDWSDLGFTFKMEDDFGNYMDCSVFHGVPFTWIDIEEVDPVFTLSHLVDGVYDSNNQEITTYPIQRNSLFFSVNGKIFGVHGPEGTIFDKTEQGEWHPQLPEGSSGYLVVSVIPDLSLIALYEDHARNKIVDSRFEWEYNPNVGKILTSFKVETQNLETGTINQPVLMSFLPHHYRNTDHPSFIVNANYKSIIGEMQTSSGTTFSFSYDFGGMPPYLPSPVNLSENRRQRLNELITARVNASENAFDGNTYAKGLNERSNIMLMAKELEHPGFVKIKNSLKRELINWLTYEPSEASSGSYFFSRYPNFGALIGFPCGYGSQAFNDLHFHYGYFVVGAARLMMVDQEFKTQYGDVVKEIAKSYANWKRYGENDDSKLPFLRNFDPYMGHSWAGGVGNFVDGNNQESTSEAMNSWFGIYLLGVALEDEEIMSIGATGFLLEGRATRYYWFNRHGDLPEAYPFNYVGILKANNLSMATYFSGDPAWAFGIQCVPSDFYYNHYLVNDPLLAAADFDAMLADRVQFGSFENTDVYANLANMGAYLGGYQLNYIKTYEPALAADLLDQFYENEAGEWTEHTNVAVNYYLANANKDYGHPAKGYHTSISTGSVYEHPETGEFTYLIYNYSTSPKDVTVYRENTAIETVSVGPHQFYNSALNNQRPVAEAGENQSLEISESTVRLDGSESYDSDGSIVIFQWSLEEGSGAYIVNPGQAITNVENLVPGDYIFKLTVTDDEGAQSFDFVSVSVPINPNEINLALNKPAESSSNQAGFTVTPVNDGDPATRWSSEAFDPQWVVIDLEQQYCLQRIELEWEAAYATDYEIHLSNSPLFEDYAIIATVSGGDGGLDVIPVDKTVAGRYLRFYGTKRATEYGYSLFEIKAFGQNTTTFIGQKNNEEPNCLIYPVPAKNTLKIVVPNEEFHVRIFNIAGIAILESESAVSEMQLDITAAKNGLYFVEIILANHKTYLKKLIINK
ncbi:glycosyl hydrolase [Anaerophaga thermohalophila]|uniref:glycosyl hydrolase n=1 Tax=Anaerophaga thermohalophila TaxID=177400 RepID=UPI000237C8C8|nr:glycosyl hydrolase [Anaerophaga thermohalophila]